MFASISLYRLELPLSTPYKLAFGPVNHFDTILVVVQSANGVIGFGDATILTGYTDETIEDSWNLVKKLAEKIVSCSEQKIEQILGEHLMQFPFAITALLTAIDMIRCPEQLAVQEDTKVPILGILNGVTRAELSDEIEKLLLKGFKTFKVKVGFDVNNDLTKVANVQSISKGLAAIRIDGNQGYSQSEALEFISKLNPEGIELFEQPCDAADWNSAEIIAKKSPVDMILDESIYGLSDIQKVKDLNAAKYVKVKLMKFGSIARLIDSIKLIKKLGMKPVLGNGVATDIGCWMEAVVAADHISNAGEMNGFLKPKESILENPLTFSDGSILLKKSYWPILRMDVITKNSLESFHYANSNTLGR